MGELIGVGIAVAVIGGAVWLLLKANRSIKAQRGNPMLKRSQRARNSIRMSRPRGGSGGGMA